MERIRPFINGACGNVACMDLPDEPACSEFVPCSCGWPPAPDVHCDNCLHEEACHDGIERDRRDEYVRTGARRFHGPD